MLESPLDVSRIPYFPPFPRLHLGKTLRNYIIPFTLYISLYPFHFFELIVGI